MNKNYIISLLSIILINSTFWLPILEAQEINPDSLLIKVRQKLEAVKDYRADIKIHLEVDFINMPDKHAKMYFKHPDKVRFTSEEFIMLPKSGIGISLRKILKEDYLSIYAGNEKINGIDHLIIKIIPDNKKSEMVLSTLWINPENMLVSRIDNTTRNNGSYLVNLEYANPDIELPTNIIISFEVENLKIPLKFIGKNAEVDKDELKKDGTKEGKVFIELNYFEINEGIEDSYFNELE
jgi:hypothetical protein